MIDMRIKEMFFDREDVMKRVGSGTRKVLSKFGAFVRQTAKNSLRYGTASSSPGTVPTVHRIQKFTRKSKSGKTRQTSPLKELIFFGFDTGKQSVVIGPTAYPSTEGKGTDVLEHGGTEVITLKSGEKVTGHYRGNPTMGPSLTKEKPKLPSMWANSIT